MALPIFHTNCKPVGEVINYQGRRFEVKRFTAGDRCAACALIKIPHCQGPELLKVFGRCCQRKDGYVYFKEIKTQKFFPHETNI